MSAPVLDGITEPGVVYDMSNEAYHADPVPCGSLSSSGARKLLPPSCPALFRYEREHGRESTSTFDIGHAAHKLALGVGPDIVRVDADDWRANAAKDAREAARADGAIPLLRGDYSQVHSMAEALRSHPVASALFDPEGGSAEASLFHVDPSGVWLRSRLDWLPSSQGRMIVPDYKTAQSANPQTFTRSAANYGYHQQAAWYSDAVTALGLAGEVAFVFVVQEKTPPYIVSIVELDSVALRIGRGLNREAIDLYAACSAADDWPGYTDDVALVSLPGWYLREFGEAL